jgi:hypothetical protein
MESNHGMTSLERLLGMLTDIEERKLIWRKIA